MWKVRTCDSQLFAVQVTAIRHGLVEYWDEFVEWTTVWQ